jgi:L-ectoine synthase
MIVRTLSEIKGTQNQVTPENGNWTSHRLLLKKDGMGFSMHDTIIRANTETPMWYKHHLEAVYCVAGTGEIEDLKTGLTYPIVNGTLYALNEHDKHIVRAETDLRLICVFNPPLTGQEVHDAEGAYPILETETMEN